MRAIPPGNMTLTPGTRIGPYEVLSMIGAGGMGEVYRARDTSLKRDVALKALPESFASDSERLARFQREAEVLASLNHPNIAAIYGLAQGNGIKALVMELIRGEDLADRIAHGPIPVDEALPIAKQIAEALEAAHEHGIIHRDLKPANIKLREDGTVKVLDFGLAKALEPVSSGAGDAAVSSTITSPAMTQIGLILGTAAYMSPERAKGRATDKGVDVWAFGCVLYEMLTGERVFAGDSVSDTLAAVLRGEPDWTRIPANVPTEIRTLIKRCLQRDRQQRVSDIAVARYVLDGAGTRSADQASAVASSSNLWRIPIWLGIGAAVGIAAAAVAWWLKPAPADHHVVTRFVHPLPEGQNLAANGLAVSPDGSKIVYAANRQLYLRRLDQLDAEPIPGTNDNPTNPVFSPDGQSLVYFVLNVSGNPTSPSAIKRISVGGGKPDTLGQAPSMAFGASWRGHAIYFAANAPQIAGIATIPETGGEVRILIPIDPSKESVGHPVLLDDRHVLFDVRPAGRSPGQAQIVMQTLGGARQVIVDRGSTPFLLQTGQLAYVNGSTLFAGPLYLERQPEVGVAVSMVDDVTVVARAGQFAIAPAGTLVYWPGRSSASKFRLVWVDRLGQETPIPAEPRAYRFPRLSPDGTKIAVNSADDEADIWIFSVAKESSRRVTFGPAVEWSPVWMRDSRHLFYRSGRQLLRMDSDQAGTPETILTDISGGYPSSVSRDEKWLMSRTGDGPIDVLMKVALDGSGTSRPLFAETKYTQRNAEISPDGQWIAYDSSESGRPEVYVRPFPDVDAHGPSKISRDGGYLPMWSRSGRELFFVSSPGQPLLMSVSVQTGSSFTYGTPQRVFDVSPYSYVFWYRAFDISLDDKRFLMVKPLGNDPSTHPSIVIVSHWSDEVQARLNAR
jgi:eukaryotic-like serine/threonine-protein kinase